MNTHLEIEFKQLLSKEIYDQIKESLFAFKLPWTQTNHYFQDRQGILSKLRYSLRVREAFDTYEFTLKIPQGFSKLEINDLISKENYQRLLNHENFESPVLDELKKVNVFVEDLILLTSLTTKRYEIKYQGGVLCIDESHYHGITDYEMEFEAEDEQTGMQIFTSLLNQYHLTYEGNCPGKFTRALQTLNTIE